MKASLQNPIYTTYIVSGTTKYNVTSAVISLDFSDAKEQMAQRVNVSLMNVSVDGKMLTNHLKVRDRVYIYANDGQKEDEVFRGFVWSRGYKSGLTSREIVLKCYDNLIYLQESEDFAFFSAGKVTKDVLASLCSKWGVALNYAYASISHAKLVLRGYLADIFTKDVLDLVKDRTGKKYVIRSEKDVMHVMESGSNTEVYNFKAGQNAITVTSECTMDGMITKVVILGKADDDDRQPVEAVVTGNTSEYGTLQKLINRAENTTIEDAKKEGESILKTDGAPKWEYELGAPDIPWIRKGDKVYVNAGDVSNSYMIVTGVERSIGNKSKEMKLTLEKP